jgi:hypothetical protein
MKRSDKTNVYQIDKLAGQAVNQNSKVVEFSAFKEKKEEDEYKKAISNILARARKVDW